jgi:hypothetical protein
MSEAVGKPGFTRIDSSSNRRECHKEAAFKKVPFFQFRPFRSNEAAFKRCLAFNSALFVRMKPPLKGAFTTIPFVAYVVVARFPRKRSATSVASKRGLRGPPMLFIMKIEQMFADASTKGES